MEAILHMPEALAIIETKCRTESHRDDRVNHVTDRQTETAFQLYIEEIYPSQGIFRVVEPCFRVPEQINHM